MADRETIIDTGDGGAAAIVAGLLAVAFVVVASFYVFSMNRGTGTTIEVTPAQVTVGVAPSAK